MAPVCSGSLPTSNGRVNYNLRLDCVSSARSVVNAAPIAVRSHSEPRFKSSFKMIDSDISFMDLRLSWLSRCMVR